MYLTQTLHQASRQNSDQPATVYETRTRSWRESIDRIARAAAGLRCIGVRSGDRVALLAHNSDHHHELLLGITWADAVVVPVNTCWSIGEVGFALSNGQARAVFVDDPHAAVLAELDGQLPDLAQVIHTDTTKARPRGAHDLEQLIATAEPVADARRDGLAGIFYTGGTTGPPRESCLATPTS